MLTLSAFCNWNFINIYNANECVMCFFRYYSFLQYSRSHWNVFKHHANYYIYLKCMRWKKKEEETWIFWVCSMLYTIHIVNTSMKNILQKRRKKAETKSIHFFGLSILYAFVFILVFTSIQKCLWKRFHTNAMFNIPMAWMVNIDIEIQFIHLFLW